MPVVALYEESLASVGLPFNGDFEENTAGRRVSSALKNSWFERSSELSHQPDFVGAFNSIFGRRFMYE
jgi:hypothetical protein